MHKFKTKEYCFSELEKCFIDGLLLGDGFINKVNSTFGLNTASKQFAEYVMGLFKREIWTEAGVMTNHIYDKRINKTLTIYRIVTHANEYFKKERERWYTKEGKKIIPEDIKINKESILLWYLGDGTLSQNFKKQRTSEIKICTNSFEKTCIEQILLPLLKNFDAKVKTINGKEPVIKIPRKKVQDFLKYIGEPPFSDYAHKWNVFPYKRKSVELNGFNYLSNDIKEKIVIDYKNNMKIKEIAKKYNVNISHAIYFCKKAGVYDKTRDKKEYEIYENGVVIGKTKNLKMFCKEHNMCYTNMLSLCSGKIKKYKNYNIKKIQT